MVEAEDDFSTAVAAALGTTGGRWRTGGDFPWTVQTTNTVDGSAVQSGYLPYGAPAGCETWLATEVKGPATISFKYIYYPYFNDTFSVLLDDTNSVLSVSEGSGSFTTWRDSGEVEIPEGVHSLRFSYRTLYQNYLSRFQGICLDSFAYTFTGEEPAVEIYSNTPVPVPSAWLKEHYPDYAEFLDDFYPAEANPDYPRVVEGKTNLDDDWEPVDYVRHRFFRFRVVLPEVDTP